MALDEKRILIIEDETLIVISLATQIEALGGKVVEAGNIDSALGIIATTDFDGAILDHKLRKQRTFAVADALVARHVPFVFTTATRPDVAPARYANIPWIEKPFLPHTVCSTLAGVMASAKD